MARLLMTVPGIGYYSALLIVSEIGNINRFPDSYHLLCWIDMLRRARKERRDPNILTCLRRQLGGDYIH